MSALPNTSLLEQLAPPRTQSVLMAAPLREPFSIRRFSGFFDALRLVMVSQKNRREREAERFYNEAIKAHSIGAFQDAEQAYIRCVDLQADHEPAHTNLAALYIRQNSFDLAEAQLKQAIEARPHFPRAYYNLGLLLRFLDRHDEALAALSKAAAMRQDHPWATIALAEIHAQRKSYKEAVDLYRRQVAGPAEKRPIWNRLGQLYLEMGDLAEAENCLRESLKHKEMPDTFYNLAWIRCRQDEGAGEACKLYEEVLQRQSEAPDALFNLALMQSWIGQYAPSVKSMVRYVNTYVAKDFHVMVDHLNKLIAAKDENHEAFLRIAQIYLEQENPKKAVDTLQKLLQSQPNLVPAIQALAHCFEHMGQYKQAIQAFIRLIKAAPRDVEGYLGLAKAYGAVENYPAAVPVLEKALALDDQDAQIHYLYATLMAQMNEPRIAHKHYKRVLTLEPSYPRIEKRLRMLEEELAESEDDSPWPTT